MEETISCFMCISARRHKRLLTEGSINEGLSTSGKRHRQTWRDVYEETFVVDSCISSDLWTFLMRCCSWTGCAMCTTLNDRQSWPFHIALTLTKWTIDIKRGLPAFFVSWTFINRFLLWISCIHGDLWTSFIFCLVWTARIALALPKIVCNTLEISSLRLENNLLNYIYNDVSRNIFLI